MPCRYGAEAMRKKVNSSDIAQCGDRRSIAYILPYWEYRRNIAYMNELYAIMEEERLVAQVLKFKGG